MSEDNQEIYDRLLALLSIKDAKIPPPVAKTMGFELTKLEPGKAVLEMDVDERHHNPMGTVHGGTIADLVDAAMGIAHLSVLKPGRGHTTLEFKINFIKAVRADRLRAMASVKRSGRTIGVTECDVLDSRGELVAHAVGTQLIIDAASG